MISTTFRLDIEPTETETDRIREEWLKIIAIKRASRIPLSFRICNADGTHHFSEVSELALSGQHYIHACNKPRVATTPMLIGTAAHFLVLGRRSGAPPLVRYSGDARKGKAWDAFKEEHEGADILTAPEWSKAETIAEAVMLHPLAQERLDGARFELPLRWEEHGGIVCSTTGIDIVTTEYMLGDLKLTHTTQPERWTRFAFRMHYPMQMAWYRRGARASGLGEPRGLFLLGVEMRAPFEVVELRLTTEMIDFADRTIDLWLEKLRGYRNSNQWPGYTQSPVMLDVPSWLRDDEDDGEDDGEGEEIAA